MDYGVAGIIQGGVTEGSSSLDPDVGEDSLWQMSLRQSESLEAPYPERPGEPDCSYYVRTGFCRFDMTCRFNHPANRRMAIAASRTKEGYPERVGQPECQYYLKTGTCKFGDTCKFDHPKEKAGIAGLVQQNILGYPLRPNEKECAYYLRTGQCKFGNTCKFHHPHPPNTMLSLHGSPLYPSVHSPTTPGQQSFAGMLTNWPSTFIPSPRWQGTSSYAPVVLPQGLVQVSGWNAYVGQLGSASSSECRQQSPGTPVQYFGTLQQSESSAGSQGGFPSYRSGSMPVGLYSLPWEKVFPERPDQPECQFYMKTGECKFGAVCRFHHPRERYIPAPNCHLSSLGLPLRPGEPLCIFYSRYGICKFGPKCKFDHPMGSLTYSLSTSPTSEATAPIPVFWHLMGSSSSSGPSSMMFAPEGSGEAGPVKPRRISLSESRQVTSKEDDHEAEDSHPSSSQTISRR